MRSLFLFISCTVVDWDSLTLFPLSGKRDESEDHTTRLAGMDVSGQVWICASWNNAMVPTAGFNLFLLRHCVPHACLPTFKEICNRNMGQSNRLKLPFWWSDALWLSKIHFHLKTKKTHHGCWLLGRILQLHLLHQPGQTLQSRWIHSVYSRQFITCSRTHDLSKRIDTTAGRALKSLHGALNRNQRGKKPLSDEYLWLPKSRKQMTEGFFFYVIPKKCREVFANKLGCSVKLKGFCGSE